MRLNVAIVFGGKSVEHEVSIITGTQFIEHMNPEKYNAIPVYVTKDNEFYYTKEMADVSYFKKRDLNAIKHQAKKIHWIKEDNNVYLCTHQFGFKKRLFPIDLVVLAVHGTNCEDGTLSAYFEFLDLPYVGSNLLSASIGQNKVVTKMLLEKKGLPVVPYVSFFKHEYEHDEERVIKQCETLPYPLIVKPASLGSSVGIKLCDDQEALRIGINQALAYDDHILVEQAITQMKEYNCAVLGRREACEASLVEEVYKEDEILSYQDKYVRRGKGGSKGMASASRTIPAPINDELKTKIQKFAKQAFITIGNSGISRIDFIYDENSQKVYINEINTIPGSFAYYLWDQKERRYETLVDELIRIALLEYKRKESLTFTYDTNLLSLEGGFKKLK